MKAMLNCFLVLMMLITLYDLSPAEEPYLDKTLPKEVTLAAYKGERYNTIVPDTLDLVDHANHATNTHNGLTHRVGNPDTNQQFGRTEATCHSRGYYRVPTGQRFEDTAVSGSIQTHGNGQPDCFCRFAT